MPRITHTLAEWRRLVHELSALHTGSPPPGLLERVQALIAQAPNGWPGQPFALELDESSAQAVHETFASLTNRDPIAGQRDASVAEAMRIIHDHQQES